MDFNCEAYGDELPGLCFFEATFLRCGTVELCHARMEWERKKLHQRINELAAAGDAMAVYLAHEFPTPASLLGGADSDPAPGRVADPVDNPAGPLPDEGS